MAQGKRPGFCIARVILSEAKDLSSGQEAIERSFASLRMTTLSDFSENSFGAQFEHAHQFPLLAAGMRPRRHPLTLEFERLVKQLLQIRPPHAVRWPFLVVIGIEKKIASNLPSGFSSLTMVST